MSRKRIVKTILFVIIILLNSCQQNKDITIRTLNVGYGYMFNPANYNIEVDSLAGPSNDAHLMQKIIETTAAKYPHIDYDEGYILTTRKKDDTVEYIDKYNCMLPSNKYIVKTINFEMDENEFDESGNDPTEFNEYTKKLRKGFLKKSMKKEFMDIVGKLCRENYKDDILIITLSGHGYSPAINNRPAFVLGITYENIYKNGNAIDIYGNPCSEDSDIAKLKPNLEYVYFDTLFDFIRDNSDGKVLVIIDTCISGNAVGKEHNMGTLSLSKYTPYVGLYEKIWVLSASEPGKNTYDNPFYTNLSNNDNPSYQGLLSYSIAKYFDFDYKNMQFGTDSKSIVTTGTLYRGVKNIMNNLDVFSTSNPKISGDPLELVLFAH